MYLVDVIFIHLLVLSLLIEGFPSANPINLPVATRMAQQVICLPMHHELSEQDVECVLSIICK